MIRVTSILLGSFFAAAQASAAPCEVFEHTNFSGPFIAIERNQSLPRLGALNDRVSSIKVGLQCLVVAFGGATTTFGPGEHPTLAEGWDNQISSLRCNCR